jgi:hypothetical protein
MLTQPLTHHAILALIEPITRRGRQIDLAASDRLERRLMFKAIEHPEIADGLPALSETLELLSLPTGHFRLTKIVTMAGVHVSRIIAEGASAADLLADLERIDPRRGFTSGDGFVIARTYRLDKADQLILTHASAQVSDLTLSFEAPAVRGYPAEYDLMCGPGLEAALPDDALALLGRPWSLLDRSKNGWRGRIKMRGREPKLSKLCEQRLTDTVQHLAALIRLPPADYHGKFQRRRWRVFMRRSVPILAGAALLCGTAALSQIKFAQGSGWQMLLFNMPPLLMIAAFGMRELPRIEIPPIPRSLKISQWLQPTSNM